MLFKRKIVCLIGVVHASVIDKGSEKLLSLCVNRFSGSTVLGSLKGNRAGSDSGCFVDLGKNEIALNWCMEAGNQVTLMCTAVCADHRASCVSANAIGDCPLTFDPFFECCPVFLGILICDHSFPPERKNTKISIILFYMIKKKLYRGKKAYIIIITRLCLEEMIMQEKLVIVPKKQQVDIRQE